MSLKAEALAGRVGVFGGNATNQSDLDSIFHK